ncbi:MAG: hypothetical protein HYY04_01695, partial [Chloroflexi bacterium]|nr:hypothetical protein [Chloroflexota bacterium]
MNTPKPPLPGMTTLIVLVVSFRLLAIPLVRPGGFFSDWTDFYYYRGLASLADQGFYPFIHFWVEYPPLFPWLAVALHQFAMGLPPYRHPLLWFSIGLSALLTLADVASLVMLRRLGDRLWGPGGGLRCAWIAALLFAPFYASFEWFDSLPTAALLTGVELLCAGRFAIAGSALAVGSLLKLFPLSVVPVAVLAATGARQRLALGLGMLAVLLAVLGPLMVLGPTMTLASFASLANRGSWETPWALLDGYYAFGVVPSLVDRVLYPASAFWTTPGRSAWVWWPVALVASVAYLALLVRLRVDRATGRRGDGTYPDAPSPPSPPTPLPRGEGRGVR